MKHKQNLHIHTTYADGRDTPEAMVLQAIDRGFDSIGFSEHSFLRQSPAPKQMTVPEMEPYKEEIRGLKAKYQGTIDIFCGMELDFYSQVPSDGFDYLIGSVHYPDCHDKYFIDCFYPLAEQLLAQAGFTSKWILTDKGFTEVAL